MSEGKDRTGLYILVFVTLLNSCDASVKSDQAVKELKLIADAVQKQQQNAAR